MDVAHGERAYFCLADVLAPEIGVVHVEHLFGCVAVDLFLGDVYAFFLLRVEECKWVLNCSILRRKTEIKS